MLYRKDICERLLITLHYQWVHCNLILDVSHRNYVRCFILIDLVIHNKELEYVCRPLRSLQNQDLSKTDNMIQTSSLMIFEGGN